MCFNQRKFCEAHASKSTVNCSTIHDVLRGVYFIANYKDAVVTEVKKYNLLKNLPAFRMCRIK